ncbi:Carbonic anhydrase [Gulbenkiania indica]|uniref:carbonic anhydrase n=2 Tax=Gulbenkiania TaxID=397456 RepID=A0A0K6GSL5_9NEIS|nr:carbonic anhydrase [Gulbenkiania indica]TCW32327.1 carbonic anhydrase [Gulbenkiania mobilis]CUA81597.1 Carbonic anhydrase [Gulbenkiania indica]
MRLFARTLLSAVLAAGLSLPSGAAPLARPIDPSSPLATQAASTVMQVRPAPVPASGGAERSHAQSSAAPAAAVAPHTAAPAQASAPTPAPREPVLLKPTAIPPRAKPRPAPVRPARPVASRHTHEAGAHADAAHGSELAQVRAAVSALLSANVRITETRGPAYYGRLVPRQTPRATVVTCADSRVQTNGFHADPTNDLFVVRNIGNQLATAEGSVEYGVRHLHTPLLLFIGHSVCGAVTAAAGDTARLEPAIQRELATIDIPRGIDVTDGVLLNVNNQVESAILKFSGEVEAGRLAILGAYYDFRNDLGQGAGRLVITNLNGETDPARIRSRLAAGDLLRYGFMR